MGRKKKILDSDKLEPEKPLEKKDQDCNKCTKDKNADLEKHSKFDKFKKGDN